MQRRAFLRMLSNATLGGAAGALPGCLDAEQESQPQSPPSLQADSADALTLFLCGDVMLGRGVDQILPHPSDPAVYESFV